MTRTKPPKPTTPQAPSTTDTPSAPTDGRLVTVRSDGQRLLMAVPLSLAKVAAAIGASKATVGDWRTGNKVPGPAFRAALEKAYGIPVASWGEAPSGVPAADVPTKAPRRAEQPPAAPSTLQDVETLLGSVKTALANDKLLSSERVRLTDSQTRLLSLKHKLERDQETQEDSLVRFNPHWLRIRTVLTETLAPFPDAARAVADKLKEL